MNAKLIKSRRVVVACCIAALCGTLALPAFAHHGWSTYDETKTLELSGVIRESGYSNPHGFVRLQVDGGKGKIWYVVLSPPARMKARGLPAEMLKKGATASVVGAPHREKDEEMRADRITIDGKTTELRQ